MERKTLRTLPVIALFFTVTGMSAQCYFPATTNGSDIVSFTHDGGSFASFGCAPLDPTYWLANNGMWITATFSAPADQPSFRVWGMNNDDIASISVNGSAYDMNSLSATIGERVLCGASPDPNGVAFSGGNIAGTNPSNFSYQDITLNMDGVNSITVTGLAGAGWGFAGVTVACDNGVEDLSAAQVRWFPNPTTGLLHLALPWTGSMEATVRNQLGQVVLRTGIVNDQLDLSTLPAGVYAVTLATNGIRATRRVVRS